MAYNSDAQYNDMIQAATADPVLADIVNNPASGDIIFKLFRAVAEAAKNILQYLEAAKNDIVATAQRAKPHTAGWSVDRIKEFRWDAANGRGYSYVLDSSGFVEYLDGTDDTNALIITSACVEEQYGVATLKVAKGTVGSLSKLSTDELAASKQYLNDRIRAAGQRMSIVSRDGDLVKVSGTLYINALYGLSAVAGNVVAALSTYVTQLTFGGVVNRNKVIDVIQAVEGVVDCDLIVIEIKPAPLSNYQTVNRESVLYAGWAIYSSGTELFTVIPA